MGPKAISKVLVISEITLYKTDLVDQLNMLKGILVESQKINSIPYVDKLIYELDIRLSLVNERLLAGDEIKILGFIDEQIVPYLPSLAKTILKYSQ